MPQVSPDDPFRRARQAMVAEQIAARGIRDARVLEAMVTVPRHRFLPERLWLEAQEDHPLPIGPGETISQPYIVAFMAEALDLLGNERILEIGSGCGYAAAVLGQIARSVHGVELDPVLAAHSQGILAELGYANVHLRQGDGHLGWPEAAPFHAILLSCSAPEVPSALWDQLAPDGRLLLPLGLPGWSQELVRVRKLADGRRQAESLLPVAFVPLRQP